MPNLLEYLREVKLKLVSSSCPKSLHIVMGNEACDLDSAVSSLVYAFLLHSLKVNDQINIVPILNIPRDDYELKTEVTYWLNQHSISSDHLVFRDILDSAVTCSGSVALTLVDHNVLSVQYRHLEPNVISILDHHQLERPNPQSVKDGMVIEMVGSCCTLVAEAMLNKYPSLLDDTTASLLYGTIVLDTVNLNEAAKRVTEKDVEMCRQLEKHLNSPVTCSTDIFQKLTTAKSNTAHLTSDQLLRKDVKIAENKIRVGVASIPMLAKEFLERPDVLEDMQQHSEKQHYDVLVIMGITLVGDNVRRDIAICSKDFELSMKMSQHLSSAGGGTLQLDAGTSQVEGCLAFKQGNHAASRKVVLPFVRDWLSLHNN
ncbi:hypothetical protein SK128_024660 [Halocaridina rubra]|uniref:DHHA2 domain-containing protein n=1 Tax=Halocaridina rubra TaxID=373956 RepID=A0AAN8WU04_HALRR